MAFKMKKFSGFKQEKSNRDNIVSKTKGLVSDVMPVVKEIAPNIYSKNKTIGIKNVSIDDRGSSAHIGLNPTRIQGGFNKNLKDGSNLSLNAGWDKDSGTFGRFTWKKTF